jgi:hypothetical protein
VARLALLGVLALVLAASAQARPQRKVMVLRLGITQHGTTRTPHPPLGDTGDVFTTTLLLRNTVAALDRPATSSVGAMLFRYVLHGTCSTENCSGATADIVAVSKLPGGTITASENGVELGQPPIVMPIVEGTGAFEGATGSVTVGQAASPVNIYRLKLP